MRVKSGNLAKHVRFPDILAENCGCERWISRNAKKRFAKDQFKSSTIIEARRNTLRRGKKIVHNRKFVPKSAKSGHNFSKTAKEEGR
ncbi:MAG: hypothetical protein EGQ84_07440 [Slackia sp.]|nr:hypothetical protein [Slackia sp.]